MADTRFNNQDGNTYSQRQQQYPSHPDTRTPRPYSGRCQICGIHGHSARTCSQLSSHVAASSRIIQSPPVNPFTPWQPRANVAVAPPLTSNNWIMDSGATHHIMSDLHNLSLHQPYHGGDEVLLGDGSGLAITHTGSSILPLPTKSLTLNKILCVPNIHKNLISVYRLCNANKVSVEFFPAHFQVKDLSTGAPILHGRTKDELYEWPVTPTLPTTFFASPTPKTSLASWHSRLGHPSLPILNTVISKFSLPLSVAPQKHLSCTDCSINKSHKLPFHETSIISTRPLEIIFSDVWSSPLVSIDNYKYYLVLVDHFTRYTWIYPLKQKSHVKDTFITFKPLVENRFQTKIGTLYSDNGGEFIALRSFLSTNGISHFTTPPHTPEHNGVSERKHRHIVETGLTLLSQAAVPHTYWPYAFAAAVYLINRMPTPVLNLTSPYAKLFQTEPNYTKLRVFGSLCFPWLRPYTHHKLENRSVPCVFIGYSLTQSAYLCLEPITGRIYTSRHVQFDESIFPFQTLTQPKPIPTTQDIANSTPSPPVTLVPLVSSSPRRPPRSGPHQPSNPTVASPGTVAHSTDTIPLQPTTTPSPLNPSPPNRPNLIPPSPPNNISQAHNQNSPTTTHPNPLTLGPIPNSFPSTSTTLTTTSPTPPSSIPQPPNPPPPAPPVPPPQPPVPPPQPEPIPSQPQNTHSMRTRSKNQITKPKTKVSLTASVTPLIRYIPTTVAEALRDPNWRAAMSEEFNAQVRNGSWDLEPPSLTQNLIGCKWIFTIKEHPDGSIDRYKARLVAKGFHQQYGLDYSETFSPVIKSVTVRTVLGVAVGKSWPIWQLDVNNAFLQGHLEDEVYVAQPPGFVDPEHPNYVCRLKKALYGLKQAPRAWYQELKNFLLGAGFLNSYADASLFIHNVAGNLLYVLVYVDDIIVTGNNDGLIKDFLTSIADRFSIKDPTELTYFLGIEVNRTSKGLHLMQRKYIQDLLTKHNMLHCKPVATPMASSPKLSLRSGHRMTDPKTYRTVVGSLQYLAFTRPDIAYAVNRLSQFMHQPTDEHWQAAKRVLRYLAGTPSHGIFLSSANHLTLHGFTDADWAGDSDDYVSTNAYVIYLGSHPISWSSKKQRGVARSSTEAEYRSVANAASEIRWLCSLLTELGISLPAAPVLYCDNIGATYLCANPVFHSRMKHIALDYHFVRNHIQSGALRVTHVHTKDQLADSLTKPLPRARFQEITSKIGVTKVPSS